MRVDAFDFELPQELIAQEPATTREEARLLVVREDHETHARIGDLASYVPRGALVVVNDTKVIRARILGTKEGSGGKAEVFLVKRIGPGERWQAMTKASKPMRPGTRVVAGPLVVTIEGREPNDGLFLVSLEASAGTLDEALRAGARVPLPPYIKRETTEADEARYQTVFAKHEGAVAAPTAGLHVTEKLLEELRAKDVAVEACTLHVGLGTFQPVTTEDLDDHAMHAEYFEISTALATAVRAARARGAPVMAIGTTVVRALESAGSEDGLVRECAEETRILIQPGYRFRVVDRLLTNFHLPKSTLLALVSAFAGTERVLHAYKQAVDARYRFFSYGDAMLLERSPA
jgi:S-adenosylmethionine:tRNA ribosyltransferase-isomerase